MTDIDKLIEAVEAGVLWAGYEWPKAWSSAQHDDAEVAMFGSIDAAHRLHEALLPGWGWMMGNRGTATVIPPEVMFAKHGTIGPTCRVDGNPARAWLLSILRAVKAQEGK